MIGTEYERTHFVTQDERYRDVFRATLDKRVTHYAFEENGDGYVGVPVGSEDFSRLEVKLDEARLAHTAIGEWLDEIIVVFRAFRIPSKKYRGMTLRSVYQVRREGLRNELPGFRSLHGVREPTCAVPRPRALRQPRAIYSELKGVSPLP